MQTPGIGLRSRLNLVFSVLGVIALALVYQLIRVQYGPYAPLFADRSRSLSGVEEEVIPARGLIFDRDGRLMAANGTRYYVEVEMLQLNAQSIYEIATVVSELSPATYQEIYDQLTFDWIGIGRYRIRLTQEQDGTSLPVVMDQLGANIVNAFLATPGPPDLSGLAVVRTPDRIYPADTLAGHVLGFTNDQGRGFFGVEGYFDEWLSGRPIKVERSIIPLEARLQPNPPAGVNLVLTIDLDIQQMVEHLLAQTIEQTRAESGEVIIMDPSNGEILAMAAWPLLNPADYSEWFTFEGETPPVIGPAVGAQFEPGSTFKVLTMAAALDAGVVKADDVFIDTGKIEVGGIPITNWNGEAWGPQTMVGCLEHSLNVCLAHLADIKLGPPLFYAYMDAFGIGQLTGVDLAGEVPGQYRSPSHPEWTRADLGTNSFGQGISLTPIQLLAAVGALANDGVMLQPHVVRQVVGPNGVYSPQPIVLGQPISAETARTVSGMLAQSLSGEASTIHVEGFRLAGKTGTAQIPTAFGYDPQKTIASFIGWGPVDDPRFMVLVRLDKPKSSPWGSVVAAPLFQKVVERLVVLMEIPPDEVRLAAGLGGGT